MIENNTKLLDKVRHDVFDPALETAVIDPLNAVSNGFNFVAEKTGSNLRTGKIAKAKETEYETPVDGAVASVAGGLAASIPYTIAGQLIGGVTRMATRRFDTFVKLPTAIAGVLMSQRTANIVSGGALDGLKDTKEGETHLGNALGGAASFAVFEHGNAKAFGLKGAQWLTQHMKVGAAGGLAHAVTSDIASGKNPLERKDYVEVALSGAAMNTVLPVVQKGAGRLIDKVNVRLGRGIPIERDFARQANVQLSELGKAAPLTRVHIIEKGMKESPRANHKEQAIFVRGADLRDRAHETQHLISGRAKTQEPLFKQAADALSKGDEWLSWQFYRQARLQEELAARKSEWSVGAHQRCLPLKNYTTIWLEEFFKFKESKGSFRPNEDFSLKYRIPFKERALPTVRGDLEASGAKLGTKVVDAFKEKKPRDLTLAEARKLLGMMKGGRERREKVEREHYEDYYNENDDCAFNEYGADELNRHTKVVDWDEYNKHYPYDPKFTRGFMELIKGKSDGARWIAKEVKFRAPVESPEDLTQEHLDELARKWNLYKEIKPLLQEPEISKFRISPYHILGIEYIRSAVDAERFLDLWTSMARPGLPFRWRENPSPYMVAQIAKYYSELPKFAQLMLAELPYGEFHKLDHKRIGNPYRLIDCARAWKVEPEFPKSIAERVGRLPSKQKFAAKVAWHETRVALEEEDLSRQERLNHFWKSFKTWSGKEPVEFYKSLADDVNLAFRMNLNQVMDRAISTFHGRALSWDERKELRRTLHRYLGEPDVDCMPLSAIVGLKTGNYKNAVKNLMLCANGRDWDEGAWCADSALRLTNVFGHRWEKWLELQSKLGIDGHDATQWLPPPTVRRLEGLDNWLLKFYDRPQDQLQKVAKNWHLLSDEDRKLSYKELMAHISSRNYVGQKHAGFSTEAARWSVPDYSYAKQEARWLASQLTEMPFPTDKKWSAGNLTAKFLRRDDPRGLYLGEHTYCCQHPDGVGSACAWHGQESPSGGFFVVEDANKNIVAQSWVWVSDDGGVCFDSIEGASLYSRDKTAIVNLYEQAAQELAKKHHKVTVGKNSKLDTSQWAPCERLEHPGDFSGYANDSQSQGLIASNPAIAKQENALDTWVRGARSTDLGYAERIAEVVYPDGWQFVTPGDHGLVLDTKEHGVVGYATWDSEGQYISDIAVLPKFTQYSMKLFHALGKYMQRVGGTWTADCRESTSYRYLKLQEKRGRVKIDSEEKTQSMNGEPMYHVKFSVPTRDARVESEMVGVAG